MARPKANIVSGLKSKRKGYKHENDTAKRWRAAGFKCQRVPLSGGLAHILGPQYHGDLHAEVLGTPLVIQNKCIAKGWRTLYRELQTHDCLIIKADREEALVVMPESLFLTLVSGGKSHDSEECSPPER